MKFIRTCQECGHEQSAKELRGGMTKSYAESKCRKCGSPSLDYGSYQPETKEEIEKQLKELEEL